ncbi:MAG: hypothetical protein Q9193_004701 [Seirophora villosa]
MVLHSQGLKQLKIINAIAIYIAVGFVAVQIALFTKVSFFTTDDKEDSLKRQSQEHIIYYKKGDRLKMHKNVILSVKKESSDEEELEAGGMPYDASSHRTYVTVH